MANTVGKKRSRGAHRQSSRLVGTMTREELRRLVIEIVEARLAEHGRPVSVAEDFDWVKAAREVRSRAPVSPDSMSRLRALREERARR